MSLSPTSVIVQKIYYQINTFKYVAVSTPPKVQTPGQGAMNVMIFVGIYLDIITLYLVLLRYMLE